MRRLILVGLVGLGGCVESPPSYYPPTPMYPIESPTSPSPFIAPVPDGSTQGGPAPLPPPVQASPLPGSPTGLPPDSPAGLPPIEPTPPAADIAPDATPDADVMPNTPPPADVVPNPQPGGTDSGNLDDTIAHLRGQDTPPPGPAAPPPVASAPPSDPPLINDMTRPGFHDHYGGLNSSGDVPAH